MHKRIVNELRLALALRPDGPLLIKSGRQAGADPTLPDMNFVRTSHALLGETVYLPGSSLRGALRSYCERIARTVDVDCCDPLGEDSCGRRLERRTDLSGAEKHKALCTICRLFGHTVVASRLGVADAYPLDPANPADEEPFRLANRTEERDGVAIDRVSGAVAVGPFQLEVVTQGAFYTELDIKNFQLWQVGLLAVALRDMGQGFVPLGFGKSKGMGRLQVDYRRLEVSYPGQFGNKQVPGTSEVPGTWELDFGRNLYGVTAFLSAEETEEYGFEPEGEVPLPVPGEAAPEWGRVTLAYQNAAEIEDVLRSTVKSWASFVQSRKKKGS